MHWDHHTIAKFVVAGDDAGFLGLGQRYGEGVTECNRMGGLDPGPSHRKRICRTKGAEGSPCSQASAAQESTTLRAGIVVRYLGGTVLLQALGQALPPRSMPCIVRQSG